MHLLNWTTDNHDIFVCICTANSAFSCMAILIYWVLLREERSCLFGVNTKFEDYVGQLHQENRTSVVMQKPMISQFADSIDVQLDSYVAHVQKLHWMSHCQTFTTRGPLLTWVNQTTAWTNNHMPRIMWYESIYPSPNFNACTFEVWQWINNFIIYFIVNVIIYPCWD